jgi:hypothetical protein
MTSDERQFCEKVLCAGTHAAKFATFTLVEQLLQAGIPGDFAECGVWAGAHPAIISFLLRKYGITNRKIHLFDSFQGIPQATVDDNPDVQRTYGLRSNLEVIRTSGISSCSVEQVKKHFVDWGVDATPMVFHTGWFQSTIPREAASVGPLAVLRLDVDLYESTRICAQALYPKVVPNGLIIDDDHGVVAEGPPACRRALFEVLDALGEPRPQAQDVPGNPGTAWWRKA